MRPIKQFLRILGFILRHPLGRKNPVRVVNNFFSWQFSQFINPRRRIVPFIGDVKLSAVKGMAGATGNIYTGLHEFNDMGFLLHFLRKEDLFADIGANIGSYTMLASGYIGCRSVCFEPVPSTFSNLVENIRVNKLESLVQAENKGVGSKNEKLFFTSGNDSVNHVVKEKRDNDNLIEVAIVPLDDVFLHQHPLLMKIDVEGFEAEVLKGMKGILESKHLRALVIELNGSGARYGFDENKIHEQLIENTFRPFIYEPFSRSLRQVDTFGSHNTIYIRDIDFVKERIATAKPVKIFSTTF